MKTRRKPYGHLVMVMWMVYLIYGVSVNGLNSEHCYAPIGMQNGEIKDSQVSASTSYDANVVGPQNGRLRLDRNGGAWCPKHSVTKEAKEYLQIDLEKMFVITGAVTQGRFGSGQGQEYAEEYMLDYWRPGFTDWRRWRNRTYSDLLPGNTNTVSEVKHLLQPPIVASKIRFVPFTDHVRTVCMRVEGLGCPWKDGLVSYSIPQGAIAPNGINLTDKTYDGVVEKNWLHGGLGQLVDGKKGEGKFDLNGEKGDTGYDWIGWRNDSMTGGLEIQFEFDRVRNFSAMHLHANNLFTKHVQVFSSAKVYFSVDGSSYSNEPVTFYYVADSMLEHSRDVTIKLHQRVGKYIKLHLYFANVWMMLSEVSFDSSLTANPMPFFEVSTLPELDWPTVLIETMKKPYLKSYNRNVDSDIEVQQDSIQTMLKRNYVTSMSPLNADTDKDAPKQHITLVISSLTTIIIFLIVAIVFIVMRNQRLKDHVIHTTLPSTFGFDKHVTFNSNISKNDKEFGFDPVPVKIPLEISEKVGYHEPFNSQMYVASNNTETTSINSPDGKKKDVDDGNNGSGAGMMNQKVFKPTMPPSQSIQESTVRSTDRDRYANPHSSSSSHGSRSTSTMSFYATKTELRDNPPPTVLPPSENYYASTEIVNPFSNMLNSPTRLLSPLATSSSSACSTTLPQSISQSMSHSMSRGSNSFVEKVDRLDKRSPEHKSICGNLNPFTSVNRSEVSNVSSSSLCVQVPSSASLSSPISSTLRYQSPKVDVIHLDDLECFSKLSEGHFGVVNLYQLKPNLLKPCKYVAVKTLRSGVAETTRQEFLLECSILGTLKHPNVTKLLNANLQADDTVYVIFEYTQFGDLYQYLQEHVAESATNLVPIVNTLSLNTLLYMTFQISAGMKYLESINYVHKDLAARNCLVGDRFQTKISVIGSRKDVYALDYCSLDNELSVVYPVRWMAWESILMGKFSTKSDVWSFAVTLWEILSFAREQPYEDLNDSDVCENAKHFYHHDNFEIILDAPINCPLEIYQLMRQCWRRNESERPNFKDIYAFLEMKMMEIFNFAR